MFQFKLGSMLNKSQRIEVLVEKLRPFFGLSDDEMGTVRRAAKLSKADLVTHMVIEMTWLRASWAASTRCIGRECRGGQRDL